MDAKTYLLVPSTRSWFQCSVISYIYILVVSDHSKSKRGLCLCIRELMLVVVLDAGGLIHCGLATVLTGINVGGLIHCGLATVLTGPLCSLFLF